MGRKSPSPWRHRVSQTLRLRPKCQCLIIHSALLGSIWRHLVRESSFHQYLAMLRKHKKKGRNAAMTLLPNYQPSSISRLIKLPSALRAENPPAFQSFIIHCSRYPIVCPTIWGANVVVGMVHDPCPIIWGVFGCNSAERLPAIGSVSALRTSFRIGSTILGTVWFKKPSSTIVSPCFSETTWYSDVMYCCSAVNAVSFSELHINHYSYPRSKPRHIPPVQ